MPNVTYADWPSAAGLQLGGNVIHFDKQNQLALVTWMVEEGGQRGSVARWNPCNTTLVLPGSTPLPGNPDHVQEYPTLAVGIQAWYATLVRGATAFGYGAILDALKTGQCACAVIEAVAKSDWGTFKGNPSAGIALLEDVEKDFSLYSSRLVGVS